jgi:hypothetical protein
VDAPEREPRLRGEARDAAIRAGIEPLEPGERPTPLVVAAAVCTTLATANVVLWAVGADVTDRPPAGLVLLFAAIALAAAWGLWNVRYGAVLAFQAVLAATIIIAGLSVLVAGNALALALCAGVIVLGSWLFWKLVRVLARLQAPGHDEPGVSA